MIRKLLCSFFFESSKIGLQNYLDLLIFLGLDLWSSLSSVVIDLFGFSLFLSQFYNLYFHNISCILSRLPVFFCKKLHKIFSYNYFNILHDHGLIASLVALSKILKSNFFPSPNMIVTNPSNILLLLIENKIYGFDRIWKILQFLLFLLSILVLLIFY